MLFYPFVQMLTIKLTRRKDVPELQKSPETQKWQEAISPRPLRSSEAPG